MSLHFYAYARKGYEFIDEVAHELKTSDTDKAGRLTRCVIRAIRNNLSMEESFGLMAQLPMALKAVYVDGWKLQNNAEHQQLNSGFIADVVKEDDSSAWRDFSSEDEVKDAIMSVFKVLSKHLVVTEFDRLVELLPADLKQFLHDEIKE